MLFENTWRQSINKAMVEQGMAYNWPSYGMLYGGDRAQRRARSKRIGIWQRHGGEVRPWSHRHGGTQTPMEFMEEKEKTRKSKPRADQLEDEVARLREMLADAGIDYEAGTP